MARNTPNQPLRLIRRPEYLTRLGITRSTEQRHRADGLLPPVVQIGPRAVGLPEHEVTSIQKARIAGADDDAIRALVCDLVALRTEAA